MPLQQNALHRLVKDISRFGGLGMVRRVLLRRDEVLFRFEYLVRSSFDFMLLFDVIV